MLIFCPIKHDMTDFRNLVLIHVLLTLILKMSIFVMFPQFAAKHLSAL